MLKKKVTVGSFLSTDEKEKFSDFEHPAVIGLFHKCGLRKSISIQRCPKESLSTDFSLSLLCFCSCNFYILDVKFHLRVSCKKPCGHVWMWELDCEEGWVPKNWCLCKRLWMQSKEHGFYSNYNWNTLERFTFFKYTSCYVDKNYRQ